MSWQEADRLDVIQLLITRQIKQKAAASRLVLSTRQVKRLLARYRERGTAGLVSGH